MKKGETIFRLAKAGAVLDCAGAVFAHHAHQRTAELHFEA